MSGSPGRTSPTRLALACIALAAGACGAQVVFVDDGQGADGAGGGTITGVGTITGTPSSGGGGAGFYCFIGPYSERCTACEASAFRCAGVEDQCDAACHEYIDCVFGCENEPSCCDACASHNVGGAERYSALVACVACEACPAECGETAPGFCAP